MANKPLQFHPEAEDEYLTSLEWYRERSLSAATKFAREFQQALAKVEKNPQRWSRCFGVCQKYFLHQFPFSIVYRELPSQILVLAVAHTHRRPGYWKRRMDWRG